MVSICQGPDPDTRRPGFKAPPGACDCHHHVYGRPGAYPLAPGRGYTPAANSTLDDYQAMAGTLGLERSVIVTGSANADNGVTLAAIARSQGRKRGVALVKPDTNDDEFERLKAGGIVGLRLSNVSKGATGFDHLEHMARRCAELGWHIELHVRSTAEALGLVPRLDKLSVDYVIDRLAQAQPGDVASGGDFGKFLDLMAGDDRCWVKLYSFYQLSASGPPAYGDMVPVARALIEARPDRVIWGSNWPHANIKVAIPNDGDMLDFLDAAAPDERTRDRILTDNPTRLYGFPPSPPPHFSNDEEKKGQMT